MKLSLDMRTTLTQTLTPQQIQYLKLLQLPVVQLEQQIRQEIEQNPMLEESGIEEPITFDEAEPFEHEDYPESTSKESFEAGYESAEDSFDDGIPKPAIEDQGDPFEFYKLIWEDDSDISPKGKNYSPDENEESFQIKDTTSFIEDIIQQLRMLSLTEEEEIIGEQLIGNVDDDGYLRRDLLEIMLEINKLISDINFETQKNLEEDKRKKLKVDNVDNPARRYAVSSDVMALLNSEINNSDIETEEEANNSILSKQQEVHILRQVTMEQLENVLKIIQNFDPPGFASRSVQECLIAQCRNSVNPSDTQVLALHILEEAYEAFSMKHYQILMKQFNVDEEYLKEAIDLIRRLNPKPGGLDSHSELNTVIPDFMVTREEETGEPIITVNDSRIPSIRLSNAYDKMKKESKINVFNKETRDWIRNKYEDAKFLIQAIRQRKNTMLKVMTAIAGLQREFFDGGPSALKPLIYKNVAEDTGLDISTVCRIVNGKYVQTEFGTYELKFFFSESLPTEDGEDVSTRVIKQILKDIIENEPKGKPFSDEKLTKELKKKGYNVARRTVAKYREQMKIPVARLRKEL